jgi:DNA-directed RNA polymerase specialized sigma24 family protein
MMPPSNAWAASENTLRATLPAAGRAHHDGVHRRGTAGSTAQHLAIGDQMSCPRTELARRRPSPAAIGINLDANLVSNAVAQLSDRHRAMIYRSYYLGQTTSEIAAELRINDGFVKHELHRALHALRANLR